jgi:restriction system protein
VRCCPGGEARCFHAGSGATWPARLRPLRAVVALGGSGTIQEINSKVLELENLTEEQEQVLHGDGPSTEIEYRLAWARTYLKGMGALNNSQRGVWATTETGRHMTPQQVEEGHVQYRLQVQEARRRRRQEEREADEQGDDGDSDASENQHWKDALLDRLLQLDPDAFERLAQRLLREAGFISATVTGRSGDGGIDGLGVYRLSLVSFPVFFQCKRYKGSVGASAVRDFRGAMAGRGDKGLLITTGTFTTEARAEATRDGAPPIDLIDGERLCELLRDQQLGVQVEGRTFEETKIDEGFFENV